MTSVRSRLFDSRTSERPGAGYPSLRVELCPVPPNTADPHGYYAEIGVPPWASEAQIRSAVRGLYRRLHPDTAERPDVERLRRINLIAAVLLDPVERFRYDTTPPGLRRLDEVYRSELSALNFSEVPPEAVEQVLSPVRPGPRWFDYLAIDRAPDDMHRAQRWYHHLGRAAVVLRHRRRVAVLLHDGPASYHEAAVPVLAIDRRWEPSTALAFGLLVAVAKVPFRFPGPGAPNPVRAQRRVG